MKKITIGIIGGGRIGRLHAENLFKMAHVNVKAMSDIYTEALTSWQTDKPVEYITADYHELLEDPEIEAVLVCTSTSTHAEIIIAAAEAGKHIFCEKPISFDLTGTKEVLEAVKKYNVAFQVGFMRRFDHNFRRLYECVEAGEVGDPQMVKITSRDPEPSPREYVMYSGGMPFDMTIHDYDMARFISGSEVEEVYVQGAVLVDNMFAECADIDTAITTLKFKNGALGVIDNSRKAAYGYDQRVEVFGSNGMATADNDYHHTVEVSSGAGIYKDKPKYFFLDRYKKAFETEMEAFVTAITEEKDAPVTGMDGLQAELIAHAADKSLKTGAPVKVKEIQAQLDQMEV